MQSIQILDQITVDKIAAGEVVERPASILKELVENAIDAGADTVTAQIRDGGISLIRVTDNGCGIPADQVRTAFLRHSTSKIRKAEDIRDLSTLGFRGEALSSIAAVTQLELLTKTKDASFGVRYEIAGGKEISLEESAASDGTTFLVRNLFYNTPARRKFLKSAVTEASHVNELMIRLSMSHPEISFRLTSDGQTRLHTSGSGRLLDVLYHIYGRDVAKELLPVDAASGDGALQITGYAARPTISRGNRNFESYFVNGRYMKNRVVAKAIEDAFKGYTMQHRYPFVVLNLQIDPARVDVNVHPQKMEVRFSNQQRLYDFLFSSLRDVLSHKELIPDVSIPDVSAPKPPMEERRYAAQNGSAAVAQNGSAAVAEASGKGHETSASPDRLLETQASYATSADPEDRRRDYFMQEMKKRVTAYHQQASHAEVYQKDAITPREQSMQRFRKNLQEQTNEQLNLFQEKFLQSEAKEHFHLIGQAFGTYWIVEYEDELYIIDQHAAHEKVLYERKIAAMKRRDVTSQYISPPIILNATMQEAEAIRSYDAYFRENGFEIEPFGGDSFAVRAVPAELSGCATAGLLSEILNDLTDDAKSALTPETICDRIASRSCKAAVKGNSRLSQREAEELISELLGLENPYHCPHGRPTIIRMSKRELEKSFKRIV